jgi:branched-subunit amino acid aminotransferase/4-amino-4-deoxychorismate lyase
MMAGPVAYLNGRYVPEAKLKLPLHDAGFVFGATVTDLCRTFRHEPFRLDEHLQRFRHSCDLARVPQPVPDEQLRTIARKLIRRNAALLAPTQDLALVMLATPGPIGYYAGQPGGAGEAPSTLALNTFPLPFHRYARLFTYGARLTVCSPVRQLPGDVVSPRIKHRSRLHWWIAEREAHEQDPAASALLLDSEHRLTETATSNVIIVKNGRILTPPLRGVLNGISLLATRELCSKLGIRFAERKLSVPDLMSADEVLLSCTSYCLAGVSAVDGYAIAWPGPIYQKLLAAWNDLVGLDVRGQILGER